MEDGAVVIVGGEKDGIKVETLLVGQAEEGRIVLKKQQLWSQGLVVIYVEWGICRIVVLNRQN